MNGRSRTRQHEAHVRLYRHELESEAYRSLSTDARALLVEFRALYKGDAHPNRVFLSRREMQRRLGVGRVRAENARDELLERGFIRLLAAGSFTQKCRHASEFALADKPLENKPGATAPKDFMRWKKITGSVSNRDGVDGQPRGDSESAQKHPHGVGEQPRQPLNDPCHVVGEQPTDKLPVHMVDEWLNEHLGAPCRNGLLLNTNCIVCRVWITEDGREFDDSHHTCDSISKAAYEKRLRASSEPRAA